MAPADGDSLVTPPSGGQAERASSAGLARTFHIRTYGCQMNEHDSERLAGLLTADGLVATDDLESADVVVLNTCCIRENADNKFYGHLGNLKSLRESRPDMQIAVGGCLAQMDRERIQQRAGHVDVVFGTHNLGRAPALLRRAATSGPLMEILDEPLPEDDPATVGSSAAALSAVRDLPYAAWVTIQIGCDNSCAFCIVPSVRGGEVSRPFAELVAEVEVLADRGVSEVTLLGQNVNSYGRDLTRRRPLFADLLRAVGAVDGISRVRFTSPHPKDLRPETIAAMADTPAVCNHLHLPLQAGSNRTLTAMRRGYTAQRYLERLAAARSAIADLAVTTDLIVGFPGESDEDFESTLAVAAEAEYDSAYTFIFSPRPGTRAADMEDQFVPEEVVAERFERLRVVVERSALAKHRDRIGKVEEVLVEGPSKRDPAVTTGRTGQNKLVHFAPVGDHRVAVGAFATVRVTGAAPHHLVGELVEVIGRPRHRTRIPVAAG
jgi:tRNA-2-methylthio-N6-dimethylallyladenosine synthase